jgi:tRNA pseudouridine55 synthase
MTSSTESLDGVLLLDKPPDMTSAKAIAVVKKLYQARKAGHTGTLDPFATGLLICCLNRATKLGRFFIKTDKTYIGTLRLGIETDTQDGTGNIISDTPVFCSEERIEAVFSQFKGRYLQTPPVYSALKHRGKPLYEYARKGQPIRKPPRAVEIHALDILKIDLPVVRFSVTCSSGTYVRTLCADIGRRLECGGHLAELRRIASGRFAVRDAATLTELKDMARHGTHFGRLIPMVETLHGMTRVVANNALTERIKNGRIIYKSDLFDSAAPRPEELVKILDPDHHLLAVLRQIDQTDQLKYECVFNSSEGR